ncbi:MAG: hypothetical protein ACR2IP_14105 [Solirubrobacteraceae bacterium]
MAFGLRRSRAASAVGSARALLARLLALIVGLVVIVIVLAIVLRALSANPSNSIVSDVHDAARALVGPFKNVFSLKGAKAALAVNWGLAAIVYLIVGTLLVRVVGGARPRRPPPSRPVG